MDKTNLKILRHLILNVTPTYRRLEISSDEFLERLNRLQAGGYLGFDIIPDGLFKGEPWKIWITEKGKHLVNTNKGS